MTEALLNQARILIVDDEPANLKLLDKMLGSQGYGQLVLIQDPREVLGHYHKARPDLILLDINMPHLDGFQVMEQLKALDDPLLPPTFSGGLAAIPPLKNEASLINSADEAL